MMASESTEEPLVKITPPCIVTPETTPTVPEIPSIFIEKYLDLPDIMREIVESGKIYRYKSISTKESSAYKFVINDKDVNINWSDLYKSPSKFAEYYADVHGVVPFKGHFPTKTEWHVFVEWVRNAAEDAGFEENDVYIAAMNFISYLEDNFTVTEDISIFENPDTCGNRIGKTIQEGGHYPGEEFLILPSRFVASILVEDMHNSIKPAALADALRTLGYKHEKTRGKKIGRKNVQCWWFNPDKFDIKTSDTMDEFLADL